MNQYTVRLLLVAVLLIAGVAAVTAQDAPATISFYYHNAAGNPQTTALQHLLNEFMEEYPNINVELRLKSMPRHVEEYTVLYAAGQAPDAGFLENWYIPSFAEQGMIRPLDEFIARDEFDFDVFMPLMREIVKFQPSETSSGQIFAMPRHSSPIAVYYNESALGSAGLPFVPATDPELTWNWESYEEYARRLTLRGNDGEILRYGGAGLNSIPHTLFPVLRSLGGSLINPESGAVEFNQGTVEALEYVTDLYVNGFVGSGSFPNGQVAMNVDISSRVAPYAELENFEWNLGVLPAGSGGRLNRSVAGTYVMFSSAEHPKETWELLKFLSRDDVQYYWATTASVLPTRVDTVQRFFADPGPLLQGLHLESFLAGLLGDVQPEAPLVNFDDVIRIFRAELDPVLKGDRAAQTALDQIAFQLEPVLRED